MGPGGSQSRCSDPFRIKLLCGEVLQQSYQYTQRIKTLQTAFCSLICMNENESFISRVIIHAWYISMKDSHKIRPLIPCYCYAY